MPSKINLCEPETGQRYAIMGGMAHERISSRQLCNCVRAGAFAPLTCISYRVLVGDTSTLTS
jgi:hypothetical protein